ncbi:HAD family hydrolase [Armatimonas sp.]|uniref:HAD family hydrolase n=1 Tax=Armatimonas sp. TaxID=1872638 RepID=UPI00286A48D5|nr:HAD family hydrolase [Armatimonas sp.]
MTHFPFRLAVFDLDGTLLGPDKEISPANAAAVVQLQSLGCTVVLASGRPHGNILRFQTQLGLQGPIVSGNGALVKVEGTGEVWRAVLFDLKLANLLLDEGRKLGITQIWDGPQGVVGWERTRHFEILEERTKATYEVVGDPRLRFPGESPFKILWIADATQIAELDQIWRARLGSRSYITITDPEYLEFSDPSVNKATALQIVAERLEIPREEIVFFGDGDNDAELLRWAGLGVAMPHSRPLALAAADTIGPEAPEENAVAAAVKQLLV